MHQGGLLPICASCKRIRDDKGYWNQIETYIRAHSEAEFSHGICPACSRKLYPQIDFEQSRTALRRTTLPAGQIPIRFVPIHFRLADEHIAGVAFEGAMRLQDGL